eukprot:gene32979-42673_t
MECKAKCPDSFEIECNCLSCQDSFVEGNTVQQFCNCNGSICQLCVREQIARNPFTYWHGSYICPWCRFKTPNLQSVEEAKSMEDEILKEACTMFFNLERSSIVRIEHQNLVLLWVGIVYLNDSQIGALDKVRRNRWEDLGYHKKKVSIREVLSYLEAELKVPLKPLLKFTLNADDVSIHMLRLDITRLFLWRKLGGPVIPFGPLAILTIPRNRLLEQWAHNKFRDSNRAMQIINTSDYYGVKELDNNRTGIVGKTFEMKSIFAGTAYEEEIESFHCDASQNGGQILSTDDAEYESALPAALIAEDCSAGGAATSRAAEKWINNMIVEADPAFQNNTATNLDLITESSSSSITLSLALPISSQKPKTAAEESDGSRDRLVEETADVEVMGKRSSVSISTGQLGDRPSPLPVLVPRARKSLLQSFAHSPGRNPLKRTSVVCLDDRMEAPTTTSSIGAREALKRSKLTSVPATSLVSSMKRHHQMNCTATSIVSSSSTLSPTSSTGIRNATTMRNPSMVSQMDDADVTAAVVLSTHAIISEPVAISTSTSATTNSIQDPATLWSDGVSAAENTLEGQPVDIPAEGQSSNITEPSSYFAQQGWHFESHPTTTSVTYPRMGAPTLDSLAILANVACSSDASSSLSAASHIRQIQALIQQQIGANHEFLTACTTDEVLATSQRLQDIITNLSAHLFTAQEAIQACLASERLNYRPS